jgi:hypothetical protein
VSDRRGGGYSDLYFSVSADAKTWDRPVLVDLGHPDTMGQSHVSVDSVAAAPESADVARLAVAVTATDVSIEKEEQYSASGVYVLTVTRSKTCSRTELVYSTRDKGVSRLSGAPAGLSESAAVSPGIPVDVTRLAPARLAVAWGSAEAGPFISSGELGGRWTSLYAGVSGNLETLVRSRILARPATEGGVIMLLARPGALQCFASSPGRGWGKPVEVAQVGRDGPGMPGVASLGGGRCLAAWGYESDLAPSPLWATEFAEPEPPAAR